MDTAQKPAENQEYLPKKPLDLPKPELDLPLPEKELPAHATPQKQVPPLPAHHSGVKTLLAWSAPGRPFRQRGKEYFISMLLIMVLVDIILFLFSMYMEMLVILSLVFVAIALATVPPHNFHYRISSEGLTIEDHFFLWQELYDFYFKKRDGQDILHIRTRAFIPGELTITLGDIHIEQLRSVLLPFLPYRELVRKNFTEKAGDFLSHNFPLERQRQKAS